MVLVLAPNILTGVAVSVAAKAVMSTAGRILPAADTTVLNAENEAAPNRILSAADVRVFTADNATAAPRITVADTATLAVEVNAA